jgi:hypothetical protein
MPQAPTCIASACSLLGNMAFGNVFSRPAWIADFKPCIQRGFCELNDDLTGMLTLLEACECCFTGVDVPAIGSALRGFGAEGADRSGTPLVKSAPMSDRNVSRGTPRRPSMAAMALWTASVPKVRHMWWPRSCQRSSATCKRAGRVKVAVRRRDKRCRV